MKKLKEDVSKEHFTFGSGPSHFSTTNKELMKSESMPTLDSKAAKLGLKKNIKQMMTNHHFDFGNDKSDFLSTFNTNFVVYSIKSIFLFKI